MPDTTRPIYEDARVDFLYGGRVAPLTKLSHAQIGKPGTFDGGCYYANGDVCPTSIQIKGSYLNEPKTADAFPATEKVKGKHIFGGMLQNEHFGHFIAESLTRLWAIHQLASDFDSIVFYKRIPTQPVAQFALSIIQTLAPSWKLVIASAISEFEMIAVPTPICDRNQGFIYGHPVNRRLLQPFTQAIASYGKGRNNRIYVSRSKLKANEGRILFETILEKNLEMDGYTIIHPQELSIAEQIECYRGATQLIFAEGSALHLYALVAPPGQKCFIVWRRKRQLTFDWQLRSFGAQETHGLPTILRLWVPEKEAHDPVHGLTELNFISLKAQLLEAGFVSKMEWLIPTSEEFKVELEQWSRKNKIGYIQYQI